MNIIHLRFRLAFLVISLSCNCLEPLSAQVCPFRSSQSDLGVRDQVYPPTQRAAPVRRDRNFSLAWGLPAEFTEILPFLGKDYQPAKHEGIDFVHSNSSVSEVLVRSVADGTVMYVRNNCPQSSLFESNISERDCGGDWGNHIVIRHPNGLFSRYAHLSPHSSKVQVGQKVLRGQVLGYMGNSGRSDIRHLHFELGVAIKINPCAPAQSFLYVYNPAIYLQWQNTHYSHY